MLAAVYSILAIALLCWLVPLAVAVGTKPARLRHIRKYRADREKANRRSLRKSKRRLAAKLYEKLKQRRAKALTIY